MGLDTTHDAWHGPYSSFMEWRMWIAKQIGITLSEMEGFSDRNYSDENRKFGTIKWDTIQDDLKYLLNHSDCDGHLTIKECKKISDRLSEILNNLERTNSNSYFYDKTVSFRNGCLLAFKNKESIKFH